MKQLPRELIVALLLGCLLAVTSGCLTDPPGPGPGPGPGPQPGPIRTDKLVVAVIHETADPLSREQQAIVYGTSLREFVKQAGGEFRALDDDADVSNADQWIKDALAAPRESMPWLIVSSKKGSTGVPLPNTLEAVQELVRKYQ